MQGRPLIIAWRDRDNAATLRQAYRHEREAEVRTRLHALWLLCEGERLHPVTSIVGVHYVTVQH